jgi:outer membrane lipoprotein SlyB
MSRKLLTIFLMILIVLGAFWICGCESDAQTGAMIGAGVGAAAGQAVGGDTKSTLIGTGIGTAAGYMIGNESDKNKN